jgi:hypothetical protein
MQEKNKLNAADAKHVEEAFRARVRIHQKKIHETHRQQLNVGKTKSEVMGVIGLTSTEVCAEPGIRAQGQ